MCRLLWLNPGVGGEHLTIQLLLATAWVLVTRVSLIYLEDMLLSLFLVQLNERERWANLRFHLFVSGVNQGNEGGREGGESLCCLRGASPQSFRK